MIWDSPRENRTTLTLHSRRAVSRQSEPSCPFHTPHFGTWLRMQNWKPSLPLHPHAWVLQLYLLFYHLPKSRALNLLEVISASVIRERAKKRKLAFLSSSRESIGGEKLENPAQITRKFGDGRWVLLVRPIAIPNSMFSNILVLSPWSWFHLLFLLPQLLLFKCMVFPSSPTQMKPQESNTWKLQEDTPLSSGLHFVLAAKTELTW